MIFTLPWALISLTSFSSLLEVTITFSDQISKLSSTAYTFPEKIEIFSALIISNLSDIIFICLALAEFTNVMNKKEIKKFFYKLLEKKFGCDSISFKKFEFFRW